MRNSNQSNQRYELLSGIGKEDSFFNANEMDNPQLVHR